MGIFLAIVGLIAIALIFGLKIYFDLIDPMIGPDRYERYLRFRMKTRGRGKLGAFIGTALRIQAAVCRLSLILVFGPAYFIYYRIWISLSAWATLFFLYFVWLRSHNQFDGNFYDWSAGYFICNAFLATSALIPGIAKSWIKSENHKQKTIAEAVQTYNLSASATAFIKKTEALNTRVEWHGALMTRMALLGPIYFIYSKRWKWLSGWGVVFIVALCIELAFDIHPQDEAQSTATVCFGGWLISNFVFAFGSLFMKCEN